jgi:hypothetical protein
MLKKNLAQRVEMEVLKEIEEAFEYGSSEAEALVVIEEAKLSFHLVNG